ncbi:hypothetical protein LguiA_007217 [Lonicera macranthoides]
MVLRFKLGNEPIMGKAMIDTYSRNARIEMVEVLFRNMVIKDVASWTSLLNGFIKCGDIQSAPEVHESKFVDLIVQEIWSKLSSKIKVEDKVLFGMKSRIEKVTSLLVEESNGTKNIEGILLNPEHLMPLEMGTKAFRKMSKLRLLEIHNTCIPKGLDHLPNELRWID